MERWRIAWSRMHTQGYTRLPKSECDRLRMQSSARARGSAQQKAVVERLVAQSLFDYIPDRAVQGIQPQRQGNGDARACLVLIDKQMPVMHGQVVTVGLRMTTEQRSKLQQLGGAAWVREQIDRASPQVSSGGDDGAG